MRAVLWLCRTRLLLTFVHFDIQSGCFRFSSESNDLFIKPQTQLKLALNRERNEACEKQWYKWIHATNNNGIENYAIQCRSSLSLSLSILFFLFRSFRPAHSLPCAISCDCFGFISMELMGFVQKP